MMEFQDKKAVPLSAFSIHASLFSSLHPPQVHYFPHASTKMYCYCHISHFGVFFQLGQVEHCILLQSKQRKISF